MSYGIYVNFPYASREEMYEMNELAHSGNMLETAKAGYLEFNFAAVEYLGKKALEYGIPDPIHNAMFPAWHKFTGNSSRYDITKRDAAHFRKCAAIYGARAFFVEDAWEKTAWESISTWLGVAAEKWEKYHAEWVLSVEYI